MNPNYSMFDKQIGMSPEIKDRPSFNNKVGSA